MGSKIIHFFKYNNAFTLAVLFVFLSTGTIFAANDDLRASVISSEDALVSVDNSYIRNVNLKKYEPEIEIIEISEDDDSYYVLYRMNTLEVIDGVWVEVSNEAELVVNRKLLGKRDLGLYVAEELQEVAAAELAYLVEVQEIEKNLGQSDRKIRTKYAGLVGRAFDPKTATFKGYKPVIPEKKKPIPVDMDAKLAALEEQKAERQAAQQAELAAQVIAATEEEEETEVEEENSEEETTEEENQEIGGSEDPATTTPVTATTSPETGGSEDPATTTPPQTGNAGTTTPPAPPVDSTPPVITLNGQANVTLSQDETYTEAGASATDNLDGDISESIHISGAVDTATAGTYQITYAVSDAAGNEATKIRTVTVEATPEPELEPEPETVPEVVE